MDHRVMPVAFVGGLVCGVVVLRTGSLAAAIGLHAGWNLGVLGAA
jgi:membrane protease YdiL (CAAX protease family)